ncbi:hypothetical protein HSBAA_25980 [Vreelandella sulfidaeris]|uniref:Uncharacterized protein n=1 Tax=Vreelandella sulfidaeris TaxID=115553 RepID=A0A455U5A9_9GAMM|nr:hypothetical protein HSBAA_25980 [Halomonas sulfidaeris]
MEIVGTCGNADGARQPDRSACRNPLNVSAAANNTASAQKPNTSNHTLNNAIWINTCRASPFIAAKQNTQANNDESG